MKIEIIYSYEKKELTIFSNGKPVAGFSGPIAIKKAKTLINY